MRVLFPQFASRLISVCVLQKTSSSAFIAVMSSTKDTSKTSSSGGAGIGSMPGSSSYGASSGATSYGSSSVGSMPGSTSYGSSSMAGSATGMGLGSSSSSMAGGAGKSTGEIYDILRADHRALEPLLHRLVTVTVINEDSTKLLQQIQDLLIPHSRAEEEVFYNSIRRASPDDGSSMHGYKEHAMAETMLNQLKASHSYNADWTKTAEKLRDAILHHVEEEETRIFAVGKRVFTEEEARQLGTAFNELKPKYVGSSAMGSMMHMIGNLMPLRFKSDPLAEQKEKEAKCSSCDSDAKGANKTTART
jgi:hemerythrin superfamily protein